MLVVAFIAHQFALPLLGAAGANAGLALAVLLPTGRPQWLALVGHGLPATAWATADTTLPYHPQISIQPKVDGVITLVGKRVT